MMSSIALLSLLLILSGTTFRLLLRCEKMTSSSFVVDRTITQLATLFRDDVHRAKQASLLPDKAAGLDLSTSDSSHVRYQVTPTGIEREVLDQQSVTARESFRLPDCQVDFTITEDLRWCRLTIDRPGPGLTEVSGSLRAAHVLEILSRVDQFEAPVSAESPAAGDGSEDRSP